MTSVETFPDRPDLIEPGDRVTVLARQTTGNVLAVLPNKPRHGQAGDGKRYLIALGGLTESCQRHEIAPHPADRRRRLEE